MGKQYHCVIVGGGVVGASLALALSQLKYRVLLIEKKPIATKSVEAFQSRTIALSYASYKIYQALDLWECLQEKAIPIKSVQVSVQGKFGSTCLREPKNQSALGYVVSANDLENVLHAKFSQKECRQYIDVLAPGEIGQYQHNPLGWTLSIISSESHEKVHCQLLVAADGINSALREKQGITTVKKDYGHFAVMANVKIPGIKPYTAIERFLAQGAIALLPWQKDYATCVWTSDEQQANYLMGLNESAFLAACQEQFGRRLNHWSALSKRVCFPLVMQLAMQQQGARFLLMGNAAHSLHPIAAQGLNLSLRDIWQLRSQIIKADERVDLGAEGFLNTYNHARQSDQQRIIFATDKIAGYMSGGPLPSALRAFGITLFDSLAPVKHLFTYLSMGLS